MRRTYWSLALLAAAALALGLAACGGDDEQAGGGGGGETTIELSEQNGSGQSGTATLVPDGESTTVTLELSNSPAVPQPVHIHSGSCAELGGVEYPLENLVDGSSTTTVDVALDELVAGDFAINAHASEDDIETYVACGDVQ